MTVIAGAEGWYEHLIAGGVWYIHGKDDGILSTKTALFAVRGKAKVGQPAKDLMSSGEQWLPWSLTEDSMVTGECKARAVQYISNSHNHQSRGEMVSK